MATRLSRLLALQHITISKEMTLRLGQFSESFRRPRAEIIDISIELCFGHIYCATVGRVYLIIVMYNVQVSTSILECRISRSVSFVIYITITIIQQSNPISFHSTASSRNTYLLRLLNVNKHQNDKNNHLIFYYELNILLLFQWHSTVL